MRIYFILLFLLSAPVHALDYYWEAKFGSMVAINRATPELACKNSLAAAKSAGYNVAFQNYTISSDGTYGHCYYSEGTMGLNFVMYRRGTSCPSDQVFDPATGICIAPENPCEELSGQMVTSDENMGTEFPLVIGPLTVSACVNGCSVPMATSTECVTKAKTFETICRFKGFYDGLQCEAGASDGFIGEPDTPLSEDPVSEVVEESQPCVYVTDAEGRKVCSSSEATYADGSQKCGQVNGALQCFPSAPASSEKTDIDTTIETTSNPDGSSTTTKKDTATTTVCSGANSCTSTSTTTTTVISRNSDGTSTSSSTSCTGANCSDASVSSNGGDTGNCPPGETCEQGENFSGDELDEVPGFGESLNTFMDAVESAPLVTSITSLHVAQGGSCNFPEAQTAIGTISMDSFCDLASVLDNLSPVFLAMWGLAAIRVLMSA